MERIRRSKTIWHRGSIRIRCHSCGHLMFREESWYGNRKKRYIWCPKCKVKSFAVIPPPEYVTVWPPKGGDPDWFEKGIKEIQNDS